MLKKSKNEQYRYRSGFRDSVFFFFLWAIPSGFCIAFLLFSLLIPVIDKTTFKNHLQEVELLRQKAKTVTCKDHQLILDIKFANSYIKSSKYMNSIWYYDWMVDDRWNSVQLIELPENL
jgi:hypothetical protein